MATPGIEPGDTKTSAFQFMPHTSQNAPTHETRKLALRRAIKDSVVMRSCGIATKICEDVKTSVAALNPKPKDPITPATLKSFMQRLMARDTSQKVLEKLGVPFTVSAMNVALAQARAQSSDAATSHTDDPVSPPDSAPQDGAPQDGAPQNGAAQDGTPPDSKAPTAETNVDPKAFDVQWVMNLLKYLTLLPAGPEHLKTADLARENALKSLFFSKVATCSVNLEFHKSLTSLKKEDELMEKLKSESGVRPGVIMVQEGVAGNISSGSTTKDMMERHDYERAVDSTMGTQFTGTGDDLDSQTLTSLRQMVAATEPEFQTMSENFQAQNPEDLGPFDGRELINGIYVDKSLAALFGFEVVYTTQFSTTAGTGVHLPNGMPLPGRSCVVAVLRVWLKSNPDDKFYWLVATTHGSGGRFDEIQLFDLIDLRTVAMLTILANLQYISTVLFPGAVCAFGGDFNASTTLAQGTIDFMWMNFQNGLKTPPVPGSMHVPSDKRGLSKEDFAKVVERFVQEPMRFFQERMKLSDLLEMGSTHLSPNPLTVDFIGLDMGSSFDWTNVQLETSARILCYNVAMVDGKLVKQSSCWTDHNAVCVMVKLPPVVLAELQEKLALPKATDIKTETPVCIMASHVVPLSQLMEFDAHLQALVAVSSYKGFTQTISCKSSKTVLVTCFETFRNTNHLKEHGKSEGLAVWRAYKQKLFADPLFEVYITDMDVWPEARHDSSARKIRTMHTHVVPEAMIATFLQEAYKFQKTVDMYESCHLKVSKPSPKGKVLVSFLETFSNIYASELHYKSDNFKAWKEFTKQIDLQTLNFVTCLSYWPDEEAATQENSIETFSDLSEDENWEKNMYDLESADQCTTSAAQMSSHASVSPSAAQYPTLTAQCPTLTA